MTPAPTAGGPLGMGDDLVVAEWRGARRRGFKPGWFTMNAAGDEDASIGDNTTSRWLNYYIEGQRWLFEELGIGVTSDSRSRRRAVQQRGRRMTAASRDAPYTAPTTYDVRYDIHAARSRTRSCCRSSTRCGRPRGSTSRAGPAIGSSATSPWRVFGEMLGADDPADGRAFCGEACGNKWRGMLFGMTNRAELDEISRSSDNKHQASGRLGYLWHRAVADMWGWC